MRKLCFSEQTGHRAETTAFSGPNNVVFEAKHRGAWAETPRGFRILETKVG